MFFKSTSNTNNIIMQMFEINSSKSTMTKLDVIDYGYLDGVNTARRSNKRVFFAGKIFINTMGLPVFVNLFTIIMD